MRNLRNFGITFAVSLVILGIVAIFAARYVANAVTDIFNASNKELSAILTPTPETSPVPGGNTNADDVMTRELDGESFNWLIVVTDKRPDVYDDYYPTKAELEKAKDEPGLLGKDYRLNKACSIAVVRADVETREYIIMTIPSITKVESAVGDYSIGEIYGIYGIEYFSEKVSSLIGLDINYYSVLNVTDLQSLTSSIGAVNCDVPVNIGFDGKEYVTYVEKVPDTGIIETEAATEKPSDKETGNDKSTEPVETEPVVESYLEPGTGLKLSKKLDSALLYRDYSDGISDETVILTSFVNGVLTNLSANSDKSLQNILKGLGDKLKTNITNEDIAKCGETIRAYSWLYKKTAVYPGRFVKASANKTATYIPDINEAIDYFYNYR